MSIRRLTFLYATAALAALTCNEAARADLLIEVDKAAQRMTVTVDGHEVKMDGSDRGDRLRHAERRV